MTPIAYLESTLVLSLALAVVGFGCFRLGLGWRPKQKKKKDD